MSMIRWNCFRFMTWALIFCKHAHICSPRPCSRFQKHSAFHGTEGPLANRCKTGMPPNGAYPFPRGLVVRTSDIPLRLVLFPPGREGRVLRGEGSGDMSANPGCVIPFFAEWDVDGPFRCCAQI